MPLLLLGLSFLLTSPTLSAMSPSATPPPDTLAALYAHNDARGLARLHAEAHSASDDLLVRYRLYPLTQDARYLKDIPAESNFDSAQDYALLAALWAYRTADAPPWKYPVYGIRSDKLLNHGRSLDPDDPYVLLVEAQSLFYRPGIFGGSTEAALAKFEALRDVLREQPTDGISPFEPEVWIWYCLRKLGRPNTDRIRDRLLAQNPPPLFRQFLIDPP